MKYIIIIFQVIKFANIYSENDLRQFKRYFDLFKKKKHKIKKRLINCTT